MKGENTYNTNRRARNIIKHLLGHIPYYKIDKKPILLFSGRRGGSTLLMEIMYSNPNTDFIDQPLNLWQWHPHFEKLPHPRKSQFTSIKKRDQSILTEYFNKLFTGEVRLRNQWNIFDDKYSLYVDRLVVKLHNCKALIRWFNNMFEGRIIYYIRHPIPTSLSIIKKGWKLQVQPYLDDEYFVNKYLDNDIVSSIKDIVKNGNDLEKFTVEWCVENIAPLSEAGKHNDWILLSFEELVMDIDNTISKLVRELDLRNSKKMKNTVRRPSQTASNKTQDDLSKKEPSYLAKKWMNEVSKININKVKRILDLFSIDVYRADEIKPSSKFSSLSDFGINPCVDENT